MAIVPLKASKLSSMVHALLQIMFDHTECLAMITFNGLTNTVVIQRKITLIMGAGQLFVHGASYLFIDFIIISSDEISTNKSSNKGVNLKALGLQLFHRRREKFVKKHKTRQVLGMSICCF